MKKIGLDLIIRITLILLLLLAGLFTTVHFISSQYKSVSSSVHVLEGSVNLWKVELDGSRSNLRVVNQGETAVVKGPVINENNMLFTILRPYFQEIMRKIISGLESIAVELPPSFTRVYTEKEWNDGIAWRLQRFAPGSRVTFAISALELKAYGSYTRGVVHIEGSARGTLRVNDHGELVVHFRNIRIGPFNLPDVLLRYLEQMHRVCIAEGRYPIRITSIEYVEGGMRISGYKIHREYLTPAAPQQPTQ